MLKILLDSLSQSPPEKHWPNNDLKIARNKQTGHKNASSDKGSML
jgi:hypothetical protein